MYTSTHTYIQYIYAHMRTEMQNMHMVAIDSTITS